MIFGKNGDQVVQKMQDWAQKKLEEAFDRKKCVSILDQLESVEFHGKMIEGKKQGRGKIVGWRNGQKMDYGTGSG